MASIDIVPGTPRWAVWAAYGVVLCVLPSAVWRIAIGLGADLGTTEAWREFQGVPGAGSVYVIGLSLLSIGAAALTLGLVQPWGEVVPRWMPLIGGRRVHHRVSLSVAGLGAVCVMAICWMSVVNWEQIIGFRGRPAPGWYEVVTAAYLPTLLWGPLLLLVSWARWRRVRHAGVRASHHRS
jgi:hypothetical protein